MPTRDSRNGVAYCGNFRISQSRLLKGTNCLFASKDHVRPVSKRLCIIFMACSCPNFVLDRLKKYFRQFVSVILHSDSYMMVRYLKRLKSSRLGRVQAFPMHGGLGMSAPSLHRESTDSLIVMYC